MNTSTPHMPEYFHQTVSMPKARLEQAFLNIKSACEEKLRIIYPFKTPSDIKNRLHQELDYLKASDAIEYFELFRMLSLDIKRSSSYFFSTMTTSGSILCYLLGDQRINPMPPHYYCPKCGYYEPVKTHLFGIDLPEKKCPNCAETINADGFNLPIESIWGSDGKKLISFEFRISPDYLPFARHVIQSAYPDRIIMPTGMFTRNDPLNANVTVVPTGFAVLPNHCTPQDFPDLLAYLEDGEPCLSGGTWEMEACRIKPIRLLPDDTIKNLITLQQKTGIYIDSILPSELRKLKWSNLYSAMVLGSNEEMLYHTMKPKNITQMVSLLAAAHNTYKQQETPADPHFIINFLEQPEFLAFPCLTREDFFDYLLDTGCARSEAFRFSECVRKGYFASQRKQTICQSFSVPEDWKKLAENCVYVFSRAHCIEYWMLYAKIAYYATIDSKVFSKVLYKSR